ncbi:ras-related protein Rab-31 [Schistocerca americana]|uniref:ras-related protein Rab-31 n=1 Tax=Schistocerca americana TaxID=7009 RepID=UPI001F502941|nr:ras-related protein Rab-31 [Schistocerca americana]XP_047104227.1 ras-related protein Rab-31 [Schistocerca piceifrons]XP_049782893.1 ras-related protein Rab-31 [Schistocerca cancellata]XP_049844117.1 ras-related protein Rab-31 [Schistocerca gregaria]XP_049952675.1 ras-related protein Rab-31 [Schistocerca serialis cubense]
MKTIEAKIVVLGAQGVGKTSMVVRYIGKMFSHHISPTIGASFFTCKINIEDTRVKLQVWDTAGQERFRSMAPMYYRNANAALLVFDITQYDSFLSVKSWVKELQRNVDEPMVLSVVGNKIDLSDGRKVSKEEASAYAESIGARYFESSALQDEGIEEVFLNTAVGLIRLCEDSSCSSLRVYDSSERMSPRTNVFHDPASPPSPPTVTQPVVHTDVPFVPAQAEVERSPFCC